MKQNNLTNKSLKIIWAVQPFSGDKAVLQSAAWCLRALVKSETAEIEPVYVWPATPLDNPNSREPSTLDIIQKEGEKELKAILNRIKIPGIQPLRILAKNALTVRQEAKELMDYALEQNAELLVVSSHGRKGIKRLFLGSFAETITLYSSIPLLIVHPGWRKSSDFKTILFPTDFSMESMEAFSRVMDMAEKRKGRIILFHKVGSDLYPPFDFAFSTQVYYQQAIEDELAANEKIVKTLVEQGKKRGVRVNVVIDKKSNGSVSEAILKQAKRLGCSMIALVSRSGPASSLLMGSSTRQVVRSSELPVWVIHPTLKQETKRESERPFFSVTEEDLKSDLIEHGESRST